MDFAKMRENANQRNRLFIIFNAVLVFFDILCEFFNGSLVIVQINERCLGEKVFFKFESATSNYLKSEQYP